MVASLAREERYKLENNHDYTLLKFIDNSLTKDLQKILNALCTAEQNPKSSFLHFYIHCYLIDDSVTRYFIKSSQYRSYTCTESEKVAYFLKFF